MLTKNDYDRFNVKRLIIEAKIFKKSENVKKRFVMKKNFEIRIKIKLTIEQYFKKRNALSFFKKLIKKKVIVAKIINFVEMSLNLNKNSLLFLKNTMKREFR